MRGERRKLEHYGFIKEVKCKREDSFLEVGKTYKGITSEGLERKGAKSGSREGMIRQL